MLSSGFLWDCPPFYRKKKKNPPVAVFPLYHRNAWGPYSLSHFQGPLVLLFWAGSKMTFMRIFLFEVRVFACFALKQGKKQELKQINNCSLGEGACYMRMCSLHSVMSSHLIWKYLCLLSSDFINFFPHFYSFYFQRNWLFFFLSFLVNVFFCVPTFFLGDYSEVGDMLSNSQRAAWVLSICSGVELLNPGAATY